MRFYVKCNRGYQRVTGVDPELHMYLFTVCAMSIACSWDLAAHFSLTLSNELLLLSYAATLETVTNHLSI